MQKNRLYFLSVKQFNKASSTIGVIKVLDKALITLENDVVYTISNEFTLYHTTKLNVFMFFKILK